MIFVNRDRIPQPAIFQSKEIEVAKRRLEDFYSRPKETRAQEKHSKPFEPELRNNFLVSLKELFKGKCAYCESYIPLQVTRSEYDHFRPKSGARGLDKEFSTDHYWWLTYDWKNLYYCCSNCNQFKSTWFPVEGNRAGINTLHNGLVLLENALLIDPCFDKPEEHLIFKENGEVDFLTTKGKTTIEIIKLNRSDLVDARRKTAEETKSEWSKFNEFFAKPQDNMLQINEVSKAWGDVFNGESDLPYLAVRRQLLSKLFKEAEIGDYLFNRDFKISKDSEFLKDNTFLSTKDQVEKFPNSVELSFESKQEISQKINTEEIRHIYVESVEIKNFKCFSHLQLEFQDVKSVFTENNDMSLSEPWLLFLGENGVGKSSLLKALTLGLIGNEYIKELGVKGSDLLKHDTKDGFVQINLVGGKEPILLTFDKHHIKSSIFQPIVNIVAYNSTRLKPYSEKLSPENSGFNGAKVRNLFDYTFSLVDADNWLSQLPKETFDRVAVTLKDLMLLDAKDTMVINNQRVIVNRGEEPFFVEELSDGYQSIFYLAVDIMATLAIENVTFDLAEGMVLIDEIGTHLHPRWKMEAVGRLRKAFPKIRFVVSTHEPLCLRGLLKNEAMVLTKDENKEVIALNDLPNPSELRIDQILTSDFFGLKSTIDPETEKLFEEYYSILAIDDIDRSDEQKLRIFELSKLIPKIKHLGDSLREDLVYYVIDELLAKKTRQKVSFNKDILKEEAIKRVLSLWNTIDNKE